jgi:hypothetical protein
MWRVGRAVEAVGWDAHHLRSCTLPLPRGIKILLRSYPAHSKFPFLHRSSEDGGLSPSSSSYEMQYLKGRCRISGVVEGGTEVWC